MEWLDKGFVEHLVSEQKMAISDVASHLRSCYPYAKGLSDANVRRFCWKHQISSKMPSISDEELKTEIERSVKEVGGTYGRRMMTAHLEAKGIRASERRVGKCLKEVSPFYHSNRQKGTQQQLNPVPYYAPFFGYNLHMDQNEKIAEFGVTMVLAVDGCSAFIPSFAVMPRKNNLAIYNDVFVPTVSAYGLWDQIVVDYGREFYLTLFMQHYLRQLSSSTRPPYKQVKSTKNNRVERLWVEVNQRIGYPIKYAMLDLEAESPISREEDQHAFAMSYVCGKVANVGLQTFVEDWNTHAIPGKGRPNSYISGGKTTPLPEPVLTAESAKCLYEAQGAYTLKEERCFGTDPVNPDQQQCRTEAFNARLLKEIGNYLFVFGETVNHNYGPIQSAISLFGSVTDEFM